MAQERRPASIPNPEAKAWHGDGTASERMWESSTPPHHTLQGAPTPTRYRGSTRFCTHTLSTGTPTPARTPRISPYPETTAQHDDTPHGNTTDGNRPHRRETPTTRAGTGTHGRDADGKDRNHGGRRRNKPVHGLSGTPDRRGPPATPHETRATARPDADGGRTMTTRDPQTASSSSATDRTPHKTQNKNHNNKSYSGNPSQGLWVLLDCGMLCITSLPNVAPRRTRSCITTRRRPSVPPIRV